MRNFLRGGDPDYLGTEFPGHFNAALGYDVADRRRHILGTEPIPVHILTSAAATVFRWLERGQIPRGTTAPPASESIVEFLGQNAVKAVMALAGADGDTDHPLMPCALD